MVQSNIMDFSTRSNAMIQNNAEGLMRKNAIHIQRKNCGSRNMKKKKNCLIKRVDGKYGWGYRL